MFEKIMDMIADVMPVIEIGNTGYLDQVPWILGPMKGTDPKGRKFIALPIESTFVYQTYEDGGRYHNKGKGVVVLFQRYSSRDDVWVQAESHKAGNGRATLGVVSSVNSKLEDVLETALQELLTKGSVKYSIPDYFFAEAEVRLLTPDEVEKLKTEKRVFFE